MEFNHSFCAHLIPTDLLHFLSENRRKNFPNQTHIGTVDTLFYFHELKTQSASVESKASGINKRAMHAHVRCIWVLAGLQILTWHQQRGGISWMWMNQSSCVETCQLTRHHPNMTSRSLSHRITGIFCFFISGQKKTLQIFIYFGRSSLHRLQDELFECFVRFFFFCIL